MRKHLTADVPDKVYTAIFFPLLDYCDAHNIHDFHVPAGKRTLWSKKLFPTKQ